MISERTVIGVCVEINVMWSETSLNFFYHVTEGMQLVCVCVCVMSISLIIRFGLQRSLVVDVVAPAQGESTAKPFEKQTKPSIIFSFISII